MFCASWKLNGIFFSFLFLLKQMKGLREELARTRKTGAKGDQPVDDGFKAPTPKIGANAVEGLACCSALDCIEFRLLECAEDVSKPGFPPSFAHQHFGDEEKIYGYPGLRISHYYSSGSLQLYTRIAFDRREPGAVPEDISGALSVYMPDEDVELESSWSSPSVDAILERVEKDKKSGWMPPGQQISSYSVGKEKFQIRFGNIADAGMREFWQRMRPFLIWFVDAANFFDDTDDRWDVFMLFREPNVIGGSLCFCGFATSYHFFAWSGLSPSQTNEPAMERFASEAGPKVVAPGVEEVVSSLVTRSYNHSANAARPWYQRRVRVSQFLILPPFQRAGHGVRLFETLCQYSRSAYAPLRDITVEGSF
jgi:histone acetyltransferase 1